jgi:hypothetical protein
MLRKKARADLRWMNVERALTLALSQRARVRAG